MIYFIVSNCVLILIHTVVDVARILRQGGLIQDGGGERENYVNFLKNYIFSLIFGRHGDILPGYVYYILIRGIGPLMRHGSNLLRSILDIKRHGFNFLRFILGSK